MARVAAFVSLGGPWPAYLGGGGWVRSGPSGAECALARVSDVDAQCNANVGACSGDVVTHLKTPKVFVSEADERKGTIGADSDGWVFE